MALWFLLKSTIYQKGSVVVINAGTVLFNIKMLNDFNHKKASSIIEEAFLLIAGLLVFYNFLRELLVT
jgi:hypothetical protein